MVLGFCAWGAGRGVPLKFEPERARRTDGEMVGVLLNNVIGLFWGSDVGSCCGVQATA